MLKVWDKITNQLTNCNGCTLLVWENYPMLYCACNFLPILGLKLILVVPQIHTYRFNGVRIYFIALARADFYPSAILAGGVLSSRSGRADGCQNCGTHVFAWWIFSIRGSMELVVHCHGQLPIYPTRACPLAKNLSNLHQIRSRLAERMSLKPLDRFTPV